MIDQSHNVTDPIESLILSSNEIVNCYAKSLLVNYNVLEEYQNKDDPIKAMQLLKNAFNTDVSSITALARLENSNAINPIQVYRSLNYKQTKSKIRVTNKGSSSGIV